MSIVGGLLTALIILIGIFVWNRKQDKKVFNPPGQLKIEVRYENDSD